MRMSETVQAAMQGLHDCDHYVRRGERNVKFFRAAAGEGVNIYREAEP